MITKLALVTLAVSLLSSCGSFTATHATSGTVAKGFFTDVGRSGSISMKMPDGEVLKGKYSALRENEIVNETFTTTSATIETTEKTQLLGQLNGMNGFPNFNVSGTANSSLLTTAILNSYGITSSSSGYGLAKGWLKSTKPGSSLFMECAVRYGLLGGGFGVAADNQGRVWKIYIGG